MDMLTIAKQRFTSKHYDESRRISEQDMQALRETLRLTPSSVNSQPWHFFEVSTPEGKEALLPAVLDFNKERVQKASHVVICAVRKDLNNAFLDRLLAQEVADGRFSAEEARNGSDSGRRHFVDLHVNQLKDALNWETHQAYIAMGFLLYAASGMGINATPIEGLDMEAMDRILKLDEQGLKTVYCVSLGYGDPSDANAVRPKSRLPLQEVYTILNN